MKTVRHHAIVFAAALVTLSAVAHAADTAWARDDAAHLLRRAGFGGTPTQIDRIHAMGMEPAVDFLISGKLPAGVESPFPHVDLPEFKIDRSLYRRSDVGRDMLGVENMRAWWLDRMVRTDRPLEEKMSLFWHGLFVSGITEVGHLNWMYDQNALFHKEALGNYKRLAHAAIHDPALIHYLNNDKNLKGTPNENLARELMELFTMGEGNGYTEKDIPEVARALTGITVRPDQDASEFNPKIHDEAPKSIFGKTGNFTGDDVVDMIFDRPEPANYLSTKLWQFFGTPQPTEAQVAAVADSLKKNNWDVAPALRTLFTHPTFYDPQMKFLLIKSPVELEASTLRLLEQPTHPRMMAAAVSLMDEAGQQLFDPPNVKGWPGGKHWITSTSIFVRYSVVAAMADGTLGGTYGRGRFLNAMYLKDRPEPAKNTPATNEDPRTAARRAEREALSRAYAERIKTWALSVPPAPPASEMVNVKALFPNLDAEPTADKVVDAAIARFLQRPMPDAGRATLIQSLGKKAIKLGDEDSDARVRKMMGLLLSTPEYQLQ